MLDNAIGENSFKGMAVGAAMTGLKQVVDGMNMGFLRLDFNQLSNNVGKGRNKSVVIFLMIRRPRRSTLVPYPTLFRSTIGGVKVIRRL